MAGAADQFRKKADECFGRAENARTSVAKSEWLRITRQWLTRAEEVDGAASNPPPTKDIAKDDTSSG